MQATDHVHLAPAHCAQVATASNALPIPAWLLDKLACPECGSALRAEFEALVCDGCHHCFPQTGGSAISLMPSCVPCADEGDWQTRLRQCDDWYNELIEVPEDAARLLQHDYAPHGVFLRGLDGDVLDVGGGRGIPRAWLDDARYVSLDPSLDWLAGGWAQVGEQFPVLRDPPDFVRGVGEQLPFRTGSFDAVLSFWSLNHAADPEQVLREAHRVLRPGGHLLLVLEDMPPAWSDLATPGFWSAGRRQALREAMLKTRLAFAGKPWPLQDDHVRIDETSLERWTSGRFRLVRREWVRGFLTCHLQALPRRSYAAAPATEACAGTPVPDGRGPSQGPAGGQ